MSNRDRKPNSGTPELPGAAAEPRSGRVQFDERGQAIWEWAVRTGMFDRNASTQRIRALTEGPVKLEIEEPAPPKPERPAPALRPASGNPYERVPTPRPGESAGSDPYSRGGARKPETLTFNPYQRGPAAKP